ncbi:MAG TPA: 30S ribosomal protein S7, partial [archaeon]|nr:30S ribosomal protein S7 [archaeon]
KETKKNPIEALVRAIENSAPVEEITSFQVGGIMVRKAVVTSPQRRVDIALRLIAQSSYHKSFNNPKGIARCLADEITAGFRNDPQSSFAVKERVRIEKEASTAR